MRENDGHILIIILEGVLNNNENGHGVMKKRDSKGLNFKIYVRYTLFRNKRFELNFMP